MLKVRLLKIWKEKADTRGYRQTIWRNSNLKTFYESMTYAYVNLWLYSIRMDCLRKQILVQNMRALQYCTCNLANTVLAMHYYYHYTLNDYICRYIPNKNALMSWTKCLHCVWATASPFLYSYSQRRECECQKYGQNKSEWIKPANNCRSWSIIDQKRSKIVK